MTSMTCPASGSGDGAARDVFAALTGDNFGSVAGWPRPRAEGLPIPWITPCVGDKVFWSGAIEQRITACREQWLCQVCGEALGGTGWVVLEHRDLIVGGSALHHRCLTLAQQLCPRLADNAGDYDEVEITRSQLGPARDENPATPSWLVV
jgi:hypothetical protein